jgi:hypothetical protein
VVALDQHDAALPLEADDAFDDVARFAALVDDVAKEHELIAARGLD